MVDAADLEQPDDRCPQRTGSDPTRQTGASHLVS